MKRYILGLILIVALIGLNAPLSASKTKPFCSQAEAEKYLRVHFNRGCRHYNHKEWRCAADEFEKVIHFFPNSDEAAEAHYFLGVAYFEMKEFDFSNCSFSKYLTASIEPPFYEDAVYYKFCIAEHFRLGKKRRPLTYRYFPKWLPGETLALTIYDEVAIALPNHDLTVAALYAKGQLLQKMGNFRDAVDTYQTLIKRFPKNELTPDCYLKIAESFCQQSLYEFQNPDILAFAELNVRKFKEEFPRDEKTETADGYVCRIKEMYAKGLSDVGLFYERMGQPEAAVIYYQSSIEEFPDTDVSKFCRARLTRLGRPFEDDEAPSASAEEEGVQEDNNESYGPQNDSYSDLNGISFEDSEASSEPRMEVRQEPVEYHQEARVCEELEPSMYQEQAINYQEQPVNYQEQAIDYQEQPQPINYQEQATDYQEQPVNYQEQSLIYQEQPDNWNASAQENPDFRESDISLEDQSAHYQEQPSDWCEFDSENSAWGDSESFGYQERQQSNYQEQPDNWNEYYSENQFYDQPEPFSYQEQSANDFEQPSSWNEYQVYDQPELFSYQEQQPVNYQEQPDNWNEYRSEDQIYDQSEPFGYQEQPVNDQEQPNNWNEYYSEDQAYDQSESFSYQEQSANDYEQPSSWNEYQVYDQPEPFNYQEQPAYDQEQPSEWNDYYSENPVCGESAPFSLQELPVIYQEQPSDWCEYDPENSFAGESEPFGLEEQEANYQPSNWFEYDPEPVYQGPIFQDQPANFQEQPTEWTEYYPPCPTCGPVDLDYDIHTNAIQEEKEAEPAPVFLHYSLLKKRQQVQRCQERRKR